MIRADLFETDAEATSRRRWRDLIERRLPEAARHRPDWPVRLDHCFARILLDEVCGRPWREIVAAPAWRNLPLDRLEAALTLGERVLLGEANLSALNERSLARRGKAGRDAGQKVTRGRDAA
ncbi:MAG TPA: GCN5-related N-acetyltransferase [Beijerinckiaceae bacterium]|jgi:hypothetical protein